MIKIKDEFYGDSKQYGN